MQPVSLVKEGKSRIIHHYKSKTVKPIEKVVVISVYRPQKISDIAYTDEGLTFIRSLFGTKDDKDTIIGVLEELSGRSKDSIVVWSQVKDDRKKNRETAVICAYDGKEFRIICSAYDSLGGCACRVSD